MALVDSDVGILKNFYLPSDTRQVKDLFRTSRKIKAKRSVPESIGGDDRDEMRIRRLLARVRKLRLMAKQLVAEE